jgi:hypothetical protein
MSDIETRHHHGNIWHDHEGGEIPHDHPAQDSPPQGDYFDRYLDRQEQATTKSHTPRNVVIGSIVAAILIAIVASVSHGGGSSGPSLTAGSATAAQMCQSFVGQSVQSLLTGQNLNETVESESGAVITSRLNSSGNEIAACNFTLDTGVVVPVTVTLFANGSLGMAGS